MLRTADQTNVTGKTLCADTESTVTLYAWDLDKGTLAENVTWQSSNTSVAAVEEGVVTFRKGGTVEITADHGSRKAVVTIKASILAQSVSIDMEDLEVASGQSLQLKGRTNEEAKNKKVTWSIEEGAQFASINSKGKLTAVKNLTGARSVIVKATAADGSGVYDTVEVTVRPLAQGVQVYSIVNDRTVFSVRSDDNWWVRNGVSFQWDLTTQGDTLSLHGDVYPFYEDSPEYNAIQSLEWKSSAPKVADFLKDRQGNLIPDAQGNAQLVCKKPGTVTVTATAADGSKQKVSFKLTVVKNVEGFELKQQAIGGGKTLELGKKIRLLPADTTTKKLSWQITGGTGAAYATVSKTGSLKTKAVTGHKTVEITVTAMDKAGCSETFTVDLYPVTKQVTLQVNGEAIPKGGLTLSPGESLQLTAVSLPENAADCYTWKSSKNAVATVDEDGYVTAGEKTGTVTITATANDGSGKKATVKIKVG